MANPKGEWILKHLIYRFINNDISATYGVVYPVIDKSYNKIFYWEARVVLNSPINGFARTLDQAKTIVETLLWETETVERV